MKKLLSLFLALTMLCTLFLSGAVADGEPEQVTILWRLYGEQLADYDLVVEELNKLLREKINVELNVIFVSAGNYDETMNLMISSGEKLDIVTVKDSFYPGFVASGMFNEMDDLLAEYGQGIIDAYNDFNYLLEATRIDGKIYGLANIDNKSNMMKVAMRNDLLEKYSIDPDTIHTYKDLEPIYQLIHEKEPDIVPVTRDPALFSSLPFTFTGASGYFDGVGDAIGVLTDENSWELSNIFASEDYMNFCSTLYDWYTKGYILKDIATTTDTATTTFKTLRYFSYWYTNNLPDEYASIDASNSYGMGITVKSLTKPIVCMIRFIACIPVTSTAPEAAMKFLALTYTDQEIVDMIYNGIKDRNYVVNADGRLEYPEGINGANSGYSTAMNFQLGNNLVMTPWANNSPTQIEDIRDVLINGERTRSLGFSFNTEPVSNEYSAVSNVMAQYRTALEYGAIDPAVYIPEFVQKLEAAGIDKIIAEKQKQLDAWVAGNQ